MTSETGQCVCWKSHPRNVATGAPEHQGSCTVSRATGRARAATQNLSGDVRGLVGAGSPSPRTALRGWAQTRDWASTQTCLAGVP